MDRGIFIAVNGAQTPEGSVPERMIINYVADVILGKTPWLNLSTACMFPCPWESQNIPTSSNITLDYQKEYAVRKDYIGTYVHKGFGTINISKTTMVESNKTFILSLTMGQYFEGRLLHSADHSFVIEPQGKFWWLSDRVPITFVLSPAGDEVIALNISLYGPYATAVPSRFDKINTIAISEDTGTQQMTCKSPVCSTADAALSHKCSRLVAFASSLVVISIVLLFN